jgi:hypothetical protein
MTTSYKITFVDQEPMVMEKANIKSTRLLSAIAHLEKERYAVGVTLKNGIKIEKAL